MLQSHFSYHMLSFLSMALSVSLVEALPRAVSCTEFTVTKASPEEKIKKAYRAFLIQCHPDKRENTVGAKEAHEDYIRGQIFFKKLLNIDQKPAQDVDIFEEMFRSAFESMERKREKKEQSEDSRQEPYFTHTQDEYRSPSDLAFLTAVENGDLSSVKKFLKEGKSPNMTFPHSKSWFPGSPVLILALARNGVKASYASIASLLIAYGANPNVVFDHTMTPLFFAITDLSVPLVKLLLEHGADPNFRNGAHLRTAVDFYSKDKKKAAAIIELLLSYKADVCKKSGLGDTAFDLANDSWELSVSDKSNLKSLYNRLRCKK